MQLVVAQDALTFNDHLRRVPLLSIHMCKCTPIESAMRVWHLPDCTGNQSFNERVMQTRLQIGFNYP